MLFCCATWEPIWITSKIQFQLQFLEPETDVFFLSSQFCVTQDKQHLHNRWPNQWISLLELITLPYVILSILWISMSFSFRNHISRRNLVWCECVMIKVHNLDGMVTQCVVFLLHSARVPCLILSSLYCSPVYWCSPSQKTLVAQQVAENCPLMWMNLWMCVPTTQTNIKCLMKMHKCMNAWEILNWWL